MRIQNEEHQNPNTNEIINQFLEDMCIMDIMKKEIEENKDKYIKIEDALKMKDEDDELFCLGLLADNLKNMGIDAVIENNEKDNYEGIFGYDDIIKEEKEEEALIVFQFITSGYLYKKKYILNFDFGEE